jgi:hypothetical protein
MEIAHKSDIIAQGTQRRSRLAKQEKIAAKAHIRRNEYHKENALRRIAESDGIDIVTGSAVTTASPRLYITN